MEIDLPAFGGWLWCCADWDRLSKIASTIGFGVGLIGVLIALATYRKSTSEVAFAHIHSLFREYLQTSGGKDQAGDQTGSFSFYVLEEMVIWLERQQGLFSRLSADDRQAWRRTIMNHLAKRPDALRNLAQGSGSYGKPFLRFVKQAVTSWRKDAASEPGPRLAPDELEHLERRLRATLCARADFNDVIGSFLSVSRCIVSLPLKLLYALVRFGFCQGRLSPLDKKAPAAPLPQTAHHPDTLSDDLLRLWDEIPEERRRQALKTLQDLSRPWPTV